MKVQTTNRFDKAFARLAPRDQRRVEAVLMLFMDQPFHPSLKNHALSGKLRGTRAFSAGYDLRIVYEEEGGHALVLLLNTGTHDEVY
ncbi:MAG: type II toxin-antitoxin system YafQ family toxin [Verrucomicrobiales bacterium]